MKKKKTEAQLKAYAIGKENLKPCKPGHTNNPNGRPKGKTMATILKEILDKKLIVVDPIEKKKASKEIKEILMLKLVAKAMIGKGNEKIINMILERLEGKPDQHITGEGLGAPATIVVQNVSTLKELQKLNE
jgi:hypothetical protein